MSQSRNTLKASIHSAILLSENIFRRITLLPMFHSNRTVSSIIITIYDRCYILIITDAVWCVPLDIDIDDMDTLGIDIEWSLIIK